MTQLHPITPPPELVRLVEEWWDQTDRQHPLTPAVLFVATQAARWGADQELEACCEWLFSNRWDQAANELHAARRSKPPSLNVRIAEAIAKGNKHDALSLLDEALPDD